MAELRKHKRYHAKEGTYAVVRGPVSKLGQVLDISKGGLAFRYIDIGERPRKSLELDLFVNDNGFRLKSVLFQTISDLKTARDFPFSSISLRRRGGKFVALTKNQLSELAYFILNHTAGEV